MTHQEKRIDQIFNPYAHLTKEYNLEKSTFHGGRGFAMKGASVKEFQFDQKVSPKQFNTAAYAGTKSSWMGNFKFSANSAKTTGKYEIPNADKAAPVKEHAVKGYVDSDKKMAVRDYAGQRPYLRRGASQDLIDKNPEKAAQGGTVGWNGTMKPMTIDDVRELLNKNK